MIEVSYAVLEHPVDVASPFIYRPEELHHIAVVRVTDLGSTGGFDLWERTGPTPRVRGGAAAVRDAYGADHDLAASDRARGIEQYGESVSFQHHVVFERHLVVSGQIAGAPATAARDAHALVPFQ